MYAFVQYKYVVYTYTLYVEQHIKSRVLPEIIYCGKYFPQWKAAANFIRIRSAL